MWKKDLRIIILSGFHVWYVCVYIYICIHTQIHITHTHTYIYGTLHGGHFAIKLFLFKT